MSVDCLAMSPFNDRISLRRSLFVGFGATSVSGVSGASGVSDASHVLASLEISSGILLALAVSTLAPLPCEAVLPGCWPVFAFFFVAYCPVEARGLRTSRIMFIGPS